MAKYYLIVCSVEEICFVLILFMDFVAVFIVTIYTGVLLKEYALRDPSAAVCCVARLTVIVFTLSTVIPIFV